MVVGAEHPPSATRTLWTQFSNIIAHATGRPQAPGTSVHKQSKRAAPRQPVGLLWVVYRLSARRAAKTQAYLQQALTSARTARALDPHLPCALATNLEGVEKTVSPEPFHSVHKTEMVRSLQVRSEWLPRLLAIANSPFELTLALDATVTICSPLLLPALTREYELSRFDLAVNFEASPLVAGLHDSTLPTVLPSRLSDVRPHNFALLVRRGQGWGALLQLWIRQLRLTPDDQFALMIVLQRLQRDRFVVGREPVRRYLDHGPSLSGGGSSNCSGAHCSTHVRVWRLREGVMGFKSVDKRRPKWSLVWPRYSRPVDGPVLALHSYEHSGVGAHRNICHALNSREDWMRLVVQGRPGRPYVALTSRSHCEANLNAASGSARFVDPLCRMLPLRPIPSSSPPQLVETLPHFWRWMRSVNLTAG